MGYGFELVERRGLRIHLSVTRQTDLFIIKHGLQASLNAAQ